MGRGEVVFFGLSVGKLLNQMKIKKADLRTVTEKLEVYAVGNIHACFIKLSYQAEETTLCLLLPGAC